MYDTTLFGKGSLWEVFEKTKNTIALEINQYKEEIVNTNIDDLCDDIYRRYSFETPVLLTEQIKRDDTIREMRVNKGSYETTVSYFQLDIPFTGKKDLFLYCPSTFTLVGIRADLSANSISLRYSINDRSSDDINREIEDDIKNIDNFLKNIDTDINSFNNKLRDLAKKDIERRIVKLKKDRSVLDGVKFPAKL